MKRITRTLGLALAATLALAVALVSRPAWADATTFYLDLSKDESVAYVTGIVHITGNVGTRMGYNSGKTVYDGQYEVDYRSDISDTRAQVQGHIDDAYSTVSDLAKQCKAAGTRGEFHMSMSPSIERKWDDRIFTVYTYNGANWADNSNNVYVIPDERNTEVLGNKTPQNGDRLVVTTGSFGMITRFCVEANGWVTDDSAVSYAVTAGDEGTYTLGSGADLALTFARADDDANTFSHFSGIQVDGATIDPSNYTAVSGSVNVTLKASYLETLSAGDHTITAVFDDGTADATFTVKVAATTDDTSDDTSDDTATTDDTSTSDDTTTTETTTTTSSTGSSSSSSASTTASASSAPRWAIPATGEPASAVALLALAGAAATLAGRRLRRG